MNYEKLHKDTIVKLQEMVNSGKITVKTACGICADFVPESEDERIRKEIINYFESRDEPTRKDIHNKWIAWLEKQEEHKSADKIKPKWKPSYEQINTLYWIADQNKDNIIGKELMTLYNDLKKLR